MTDNPEFLTVPEVATRLRVDPATVRRWIEAGTLPAVKPGRHYRVDPLDVAQLLATSRTTTPLSTPLAGEASQVVTL